MNEDLLYQELLPEGEIKNSQGIIDDESFSYEGYQVVRGEFFAHLFEPSVTLNKEKVSVNAACLRKLPNVDYVQFLVNPTEKKLAVKPCCEEAKDSFRWSSGEGKARKPKSITCRIFLAKIMSLMGWNPEYRYKILGKLIRTKEDMLFVFDLNSAETYRNQKKGEQAATRSPIYPEDWKNQFGVPVNEHKDTMQISIFDDYAVFRIDRDEENRKEEKVNGELENTGNFTGSEEIKDQNS